MIASQRFLSLLIVLLGIWGASGMARADAQLGQNELPVHDVARMGNQTEMARMLKADPALRDTPTLALGSMPLHLAALNLDSGPLKALLAAGAPVNVRDKNGATPLHMAAFATRTENAKLLLRAGADPMIKTHEGRDVASLARRVRADEVAGIVSMWLLKGCKAGMTCF